MSDGVLKRTAAHLGTVHRVIFGHRVRVPTEHGFAVCKTLSTQHLSLSVLRTQCTSYVITLLKRSTELFYFIDYRMRRPVGCRTAILGRFR